METVSRSTAIKRTSGLRLLRSQTNGNTLFYRILHLCSQVSDFSEVKLMETVCVGVCLFQYYVSDFSEVKLMETLWGCTAHHPHRGVSDFSEVKLMETEGTTCKGGIVLKVSDFSEVKLMETLCSESNSDDSRSLRLLRSQTNGNTLSHAAQSLGK